MPRHPPARDGGTLEVSGAQKAPTTVPPTKRMNKENDR
jgi:hypothetical protein